MTRESVSALDRALSQARYLGELERLEALAADVRPTASRPAMRCGARRRARELAPLTAVAAGVRADGRVCWRSGRRTSRPIDDDDPFASRERRARAAIVDMLAALAAGHARARRSRVDDRRGRHRGPALDRGADVRSRGARRDAACICSTIRPSATATSTTSPSSAWSSPTGRSGRAGTSSTRRRCSSRSAGRRRRIAAAAADARFLDLLASASRRTPVSTFTLDEDALVIAIDAARRDPARAAVDGCARSRRRGARVRRRSAVARAGRARTVSTGDARDVGRAARRADRRPMRPTFTAPCARRPSRAWSVSAIETYLDCPFKFFAQHVLQARRGARGRRGHGPAPAGAVRARRVRGVLRGVAGRRASRDHAARISTRRARCSPRSSIARSSGCPTRRRASSGRACSARRPRPASARRCSAWKPSGRSPWSSVCSSTGSTASSRSRPPTARGRLRCAARPTGSICSRTARSG